MWALSEGGASDDGENPQARMFLAGGSPFICSARGGWLWWRVGREGGYRGGKKKNLGIVTPPPPITNKWGGRVDVSEGWLLGYNSSNFG
jgi:hypothetical protein